METGSVVPTAVDGYAYKPLYFKVVKVTRQNDDYLVQLDGSIPKGESLNSMLVSGGYISRVGLTLGEINYSGTPLTPKEWHPGEASTALNYNTFTAGVNTNADLAKLDKEQMSALEERITVYAEPYEDAIKAQDEINKARNETLAEDIEVELRTITPDELPPIIIDRDDWQVWNVLFNDGNGIVRE